MRLTYLIFVSWAGIILTGCATNKEPRLMPTAEFAPIMPIPEQKSEQVTGGIYSSGRGLFGNLRAYEPSKKKVGDLITVLLDESTQASRTSGLKTTRESENDVMNANILNTAAQRLGVGTGITQGMEVDGGDITSDGSGVANQKARITGSISAMVVEVFANGNLMIIGEKQLALTEGSEFIRVKGIIRPADIQPDNTVLSQRIANAQISYRGTGELTDASKTAWGTNLLYKFWPF